MEQQLAQKVKREPYFIAYVILKLILKNLYDIIGLAKNEKTWRLVIASLITMRMPGFQ